MKPVLPPQLHKNRFDLAYCAGVNAFRTGIDENPFSHGQLMEYCAWSAGHYDALRGMI